MREVTQSEFFKALHADPRDIMPCIVSSHYPYTSDWRCVRTGATWGRTVDVIPPGSALAVTTYFLASS